MTKIVNQFGREVPNLATAIEEVRDLLPEESCPQNWLEFGASAVRDLIRVWDRDGYD